MPISKIAGAQSLRPLIEDFKPHALITVTSSLDRWICPHLKSMNRFASGNRKANPSGTSDCNDRPARHNLSRGNDPAITRRSMPLCAVNRSGPRATGSTRLQADRILPPSPGLTLRRNGDILHSPDTPLHGRPRCAAPAGVSPVSNVEIPLPRSLPAAAVRDLLCEPRMPLQVHLLPDHHAGQAMETA